jgi:hypothetical protein
VINRERFEGGILASAWSDWQDARGGQEVRVADLRAENRIEKVRWTDIDNKPTNQLHGAESFLRS